MTGVKRDLAAEKSVPCDLCGAGVGHPCSVQTLDGPFATHSVRREAAYRRNTLVFEHERREVFGHLHGVLNHELQQRGQRTGTASSIDTLSRPIRVPAWFAAEHDAMLDAVNQLRVARGFRPILGDLIARAEHQAREHPDYAQAFARRCVDLVFWDDPVI